MYQKQSNKEREYQVYNTWIKKATQCFYLGSSSINKLFYQFFGLSLSFSLSLSLLLGFAPFIFLLYGRSPALPFGWLPDSQP